MPLSAFKNLFSPKNNMPNENWWEDKFRIMMRNSGAIYEHDSITMEKILAEQRKRIQTEYPNPCYSKDEIVRILNEIIKELEKTKATPIRKGSSLTARNQGFNEGLQQAIWIIEAVRDNNKTTTFCPPNHKYR